MRVLDCTLSDTDAVHALEQTCIVCPWSRADIERAMADTAVIFLKAEADGKLVGYAGGRVILDELEVYNVAVDPAYRRMGAGVRLLNALLDAAAKRGAVKAYLEVACDNEPALGLYRKFGFTVSYVRKAYYGATDAFVMERTM